MTTPTLKYDISVVGMEKIERALSHIESRVREHNLRLVRSTGGSGMGMAARTAGTLTPAAQEAAFRRGLQREEAEAKRSAERAAAAATRAHEKAERDQTRTTARELKERERLEAQSAAYQRRLKDQHHREGFRRERDEARMHAQTVARSQSQWRSNVTGVMGNAGSALSAVGRAGMTLAGVAGGAIFANATHTYLKNSGAATALAAQMAVGGESTNSIRDRRRGIMVNAEGIKGFSTAEAIDAQRTFGGKAGDYEMGGKLLGGLSKVSLATGVNLNDVADVAANAYVKLSKTMKGADLEKATLETVRTFAGQGNVGAVEIKDLAQYAGRITSAASGYTGSRQANMSALGAMAQVAIGSGAASDAAEATTTVERFSGDLIKNFGDAKSMGIDIFSDKTRTKKRGPEDIMVDVLEKTKGDQVKLKKLFGLESIKMVQGFADIYGTGEAKEKGGGAKAVRAEFGRFNKASLSEKDAEARAAARLADEDMRLAESMKELNSAIGKELAPALLTITGHVAELAPLLGRLASTTSDAVGFFGKNPLTSIGAVISLTVTKSIVAAGIGNAIKNAVLGLGSGGGVGAVPVGGKLSGVGGIAGALAAVSVGMATFTITTAVLNIADTTKKTNNSLVGTSSSVGTDLQLIDRGDGSEEEKARRKIAKIEAAEKKLSSAEGNRGLIEVLTNGNVAETRAARKSLAEDKAAAEAQLSAALSLKEAAAALRDITQMSPVTGQPSRAADVYDNWGR
jgi:hypothetical protein